MVGQTKTIMEINNRAAAMDDALLIFYDGDRKESFTVRDLMNALAAARKQQAKYIGSSDGMLSAEKVLPGGRMAMLDGNGQWVPVPDALANQKLLGTEKKGKK